MPGHYGKKPAKKNATAKKLMANTPKMPAKVAKAISKNMKKK